MDERAARYDAATIEQAVLTVLFEMRALINVFEHKGLLRVGEVSEEIQRMKNLAAGFASAGGRRDRGDPAAARPERVSGTSRANGDSWAGVHAPDPAGGHARPETGDGRI